MEKEKVGVTKNGEDMIAYTLINKNGMQAKIMNFGCNLLELWVPDKEGILTDVVLGYVDSGARCAPLLITKH